VHKLRFRLRSLFSRRSVERELDEEMQFHLEHLIEQNVAVGMDAEAARLEALKQFAGVEQSKEACRDARATWLEAWLRDIRHAVRVLRRSPAFALTVMLSLGLGVGANSATFSLLDQALLRPLPARDPQQLTLLSWNGPFPGRWWGQTTDKDLLSHPLYRELAAENREHLHLFSELFARKPATVYLAAGADAEPVSAELVSGNYFAALGARAAMGRLLDESDDQRPGEHAVVVLSHDYWRARLGGPADIVGRKVLVNGRSMTVVGVAASGFRGTDPIEAPALWMPTMMQAQAAGSDFGAMIEDRRAKWLHVFGRLTPGTSLDRARAGLQPWFRSMLEADTRRSDWPTVGEAERRRFLGSTLEVLPAASGRSDQRTVLERPLSILFGATGLVLLLACLNVANLLLARNFARSRELAVRAALGASGRQIARELAVQAGVLALGGAALGLAVAPFVSRTLLSFLPETVTLTSHIDARVLGFALAISVLAALGFGVGPALRASRAHPAQSLKRQSSAVTGGARLRRVLVIGQIALALLLLISAGLFARTLSGLRARAELGRVDLLTFRVDLSRASYVRAHARQRVLDVLEALGSLPEVEGAAFSRLRLMSGGGFNARLTLGPDRSPLTGEVHGYFVSPGLFRTLGVPFLHGRDFRDTPENPDPRAAYSSAIVSRSFVERYLPGRNPIGARIGFGTGEAPAIEIIGVVGDFHYRGLRKPEVQVYFPALEKPLQGATFFVHTRGPAEAAFPSVRATVRRLDPALPVVGLRTLAAEVDSALITERFLATLSWAFSVLAVLLAVIGLYGVLSFVVSRRTREIGIRLALGASPLSAMVSVVTEAAVLTLIGVGLALPVAWALGRFVESQLFGLRAMDAAVIGSAAALVLLVSLLSSALPARRAARVNPTDALRFE
jgi:predicted permease